MLTPAEFVESLSKSRLVSNDIIEELLSELSAVASGEELGDQLVARGLLTPWQLRRLIAGRTSGYFLDKGRYVLVDELGRGGMGIVYKARHTRMGRFVAIKMLPRRVSTDQKVLDRFRREIELASQLEHENIVRAYDVGDTGKDHRKPYVVLEFVDGRSLSEIVAHHGRLEFGQAAAVICRVADGLGEMHALGIIHRDIKPQNVLVSRRGLVKLTDIGLARILQPNDSNPHVSMTQEGAILGTVDYMSPEQSRDSRSADSRSDLYSLGATLYYLLAGRPPYGSSTIIEKLQKLTNERPRPLGEIRVDCPRALVRIVEKMMARRPADRYATANEIQQALTPFADDRITIRPPAASSNTVDGRTGDSYEVTVLTDNESMSAGFKTKAPVGRWWIWIVLLASALIAFGVWIGRIVG